MQGGADPTPGITPSSPIQKLIGFMPSDAEPIRVWRIVEKEEQLMQDSEVFGCTSPKALKLQELTRIQLTASVLQGLAGMLSIFLPLDCKSVKTETL